MSSAARSTYCTLCRSDQSRPLGSESCESFLQCAVCALVFKDQKLWLSGADEKQWYSLHENSIDNQGYVDFLWPVVEQVRRRKPTESRGIDYGCGPEPVLVELLRREGYRKVHAYDPYFFPTPLESCYDFITCTEAAEHFNDPHREFVRLFSALSEGGTLLLMTQLYDHATDFAKWYYAKDPTHIVFYSEQTLKWIAQRFGAELEICSNRLVVFKLGETLP